MRTNRPFTLIFFLLFSSGAYAFLTLRANNHSGSGCLPVQLSLLK
jgi:hypothetical protein